jgi:hypothetical protein
VGLGRIQETKVSAEGAAEASQWTIRTGWRARGAPAEQGPGGGPSSGVAILARVSQGLSALPGRGSECVDGRSVAGRPYLPGVTRRCGRAVYLIEGRGSDEENAGTAVEIGHAVVTEKQGGTHSGGAEGGRPRWAASGEDHACALGRAGQDAARPPAAEGGDYVAGVAAASWSRPQ